MDIFRKRQMMLTDHNVPRYNLHCSESGSLKTVQRSDLRRVAEPKSFAVAAKFKADVALKSFHRAQQSPVNVLDMGGHRDPQFL